MHIVITGSNRGIGLEFVNQYLANGHQVTATARNPDSLSSLIALHKGKLRLLTLDVASEDDARKLGAAITDPVDLVINNAGVIGQSATLSSLNLEDLLLTYRVNALGPLFVTRALLPHLRRGTGKKLVHITSKMGSISDNTSGGYYAYRMSKAALNMANANLAHELRPDGITTAVLNPGWVQTRMGGPGAPLPVEVAVEQMIRVIDDLTLEKTGGFFHYNGDPIPW